MIQKSHRNDRRILTFPAVHPCEGISPATLLESLINLSSNICSFKSIFFSTQRKNARETIRQVSNILIILEEIREHLPGVSGTMMLCLLELHLTFQKIQFLLEDCTREGARLWILMKSLFVATQFRALIRSVATALDVLPLNSMNIAWELKELVELESKQAQKAKMELDPEDERAMERVILILNQFENRFEPDSSFMKRVLDYLGIETWFECQKEIKFLEEEISFTCSEGEEREVPLLSSLVGLLSYCRGVLFNDFVYGSIDSSDGTNHMEPVSPLNPEDFRCPISLELMTDPVTVSTGQTYDRVSIQKWLKAGKFICPKTGEKLISMELVPNSAVKKLIQQFCADNGLSMAKSRKNNRDVLRTILPGSPAAGEAIKFLSEFLSCKLYFGSDHQRKKAAYEIRLLSKSNIFNRACLIEADCIPPLLKLLTSADPLMQENAISAILKLSKHSAGNQQIVEKGGLKSILSVLKHGLKMEARQIAAATVFYLTSVRENRRLIGDTPGAVQALVELIKEGSSCGKKNAIVAIFGLLLSHKNHHKVLAAETVPVLVDVLAASDKAELLTDTLAVIATLADTADGSFQILQASALPIILSLLHAAPSRAGGEYCVSILLSLCLNCGAEVVRILARDHSLMPVLYSLLNEGTSQASKKARSLIKILHKYSETSSSYFIREISQENFVDVR